eukprot:gb/GECG01014953.1/.p1 GENE.gb/GECG01014953.1/~~gb/GECG01014953.1/.p1  ORF type:complete len:589 (+),score=50.95 gb/GECG01014953.1/:1-1767(+)
MTCNPKSPQFLIFLVLICFGLTAWSVVSVWKAFTRIKQWEPEREGIQELFDMWESKPVSDASITDADVGLESCGGDSVFSHFEWPVCSQATPLYLASSTSYRLLCLQGSKEPPCVCPISASEQDHPFFSHSSSCSPAAIRAGCEDDVIFAERDIVMWRNETAICGDAVGGDSRQFLFLASDGSVRARPTPNNGKCPQGFKICGVNATQEARGTCMPLGEPCPLTKLRIMTLQEFDSRKEEEGFEELEPSSRSKNSQYVLAKSRRSEENLAPIIKVGIGFERPCVTDSSFRTYRERGKNGRNTYDTSCEHTDTGWEQIDAQSEEQLLKQSFLAEANNPTGGTCHPDSDGTGMSFGFDQCLNTDDICFKATRFTVCEKLLKFAETAEKTFHIYVRREPAWHNSCHVDIGDLAERRSHLEDDGLQSTWTLFIALNISLNSLVGFIAPFYLLREILTNDLVCCRGGKIAPKFSQRHIIPEDQRLSVLQCLVRYLLNQWMVLLLCIGKLIAAIFFASIVDDHYSFWSSLEDSGCTAKAEEVRFHLVANEFKAVFFWTLQTAFADGFHICYTLILIALLRSAVQAGVSPEDDSD